MGTTRAGIGATLLLLLVTACGDAAAPAAPPSTTDTGVTTVTASPTTSLPNPADLSSRLVAWCGRSSVEFCAWGLREVGFQQTVDRVECLVAASSIDEFINSDCNRDDTPPETTIPSPTTTLVATDFAELARVERWMRQILLEAHPQGEIQAGIVLETPGSLDDAVALGESLGATPTGVWRSDWVCFDPYGENGLEGWPGQPARFAYLDGAGEAGRLRAAAEASGEPIVARDFFEAQLTLIVLASEAVTAPGVVVEVVVADVAISDLSAMETIPGVSAVRVLSAWDRGLWPGDLSESDAPDCE